MFIDTHSHLYFKELQDHIPEILSQMEKDAVSYAIQVGTTIETSQYCVDLAKKYSTLRATVWIHPCEAQDMPIEEIPSTIQMLEKFLIENTSIVWIGEIGLDYYHLSNDSQEKEKQKIAQDLWFWAQLELAKRHQLPVIIHTRNCSNETLSLLKKNNITNFVIHCFSEDWDFAEKIFAFSSEAMISFTGLMTYPRSTNIQEVAKNAPLNRIMIETDSPLLIPQSLKGKVPYSQPSHVIQVFEKICELRPEPRDVIEQQIWENSIHFFHL